MSSIHNYHQFTIENNVLKGKVESYDEDFTSFGEFVLRGLEDDSDLVGQIDTITGEEWTFGKIRDRSVRCALWMQSQGLHPRDVVVVCSESRLDYAIPCFGALYLGAVFHPWDVTMDAENFRHLMNIAKPKMAFVSAGSAAVLAKVAKEVGIDMKIIVFGRVPGFSEFDNVIAGLGIEEVEKFGCSPIESSEEIAVILLSSGTTGSPKCVALSHRALTTGSRGRAALCKAAKVRLSFTASHWISAVMRMFSPLWLKNPFLVSPKFERYSACATIEKYKGDWVLMTPCMINQLITSDAVSQYNLSSLTEVCCGGGYLSLASYKALQQLLPNAQITSTYGMTEIGGSVARQMMEFQPGRCGEVIENTQVKVIDPETGRTLGANQKGEMLLKTASMMSFYHDDPQATAQAIDEEGWAHSGDLGYYDENGEVFFIDRIKDIIRCGDDDINPSEIENVIFSHPGVKDVAVVGQPHPEDGDRLIAFVVRAEISCDNDRQVTETDIVNLVAAQLPESRRLRAGVRFIDDLPKTSTDKIRRTELRNLARSMVKM